jgi:hypothetical protein
MQRSRVLLAAFLAAIQVPVQAGRSSLEDSLSPAELQRLVESREKADQELRRAGAYKGSPRIFNSFRNPRAAIAIVKIDRVDTTSKVSFALTLSVENLLRGRLSSQVVAECFWSPKPWVWRSPSCTLPIKPEAGQRMVAGFMPSDGVNAQKLSLFGVLDMNNPTHPLFCP